MCTAFEISPDDIESVLHSYSLRVANTQGQSFEAMAAELIDEIDRDRVEKAALKGGVDLGDQTSAALAEIKDILVEMGVLEF